jgi:hypothetical protein
MKAKLHNSNILTALILLLAAFFFSSCWIGRSGKQLYAAFFGEATSDCIQIINFQDHQAFDDASAWLTFKTCPSELNRILSKDKYSKQIITKMEAHQEESVTYSGSFPEWWTPSNLGDSCFKYEYYDQKENTARQLYVSIDQTIVYCRDMDMTP